jgi:hypothetical protein
MKPTPDLHLEPINLLSEGWGPHLRLARSSLENVLIAAMFMAVALDMGGQIGARDIVLSIGAVMLIIVRRIVIPRQFALLFALLVVYPTFLLLVGVLKNADHSVAVSQYKSTVLAFILLVILSNSPYAILAKILYYSISFTALIAVVLAISLSLDINVFDGLIGRLHEESAGYFGLRGVGEFNIPIIYFKATLFYVPAALYFLFRGSIFVYFICVMGLVAATSKAGMLFVLIATIIFLFYKGKILSKTLIGVFVSLLLLFIFQSPIIRLFFEMQEGYDSTIQVRIGHMSSIRQLFSDHPLEFLFGFGLGTEFYSEGVGQYVTNIEVDHLNCIRKYGLIWSCIFFGIVLHTSIRSMKSHVKEIRVLGVCLISAFIVAGTNPVLISPVFFLILLVTILANMQSRASGSD